MASLVSSTVCGRMLWGVRMKAFCTNSFMQRYLRDKAPGYVFSYTSWWEHLQHVYDSSEGRKERCGACLPQTMQLWEEGEKTVTSFCPRSTAGIQASWRLHCKLQLSTALPSVLYVKQMRLKKEAEDFCLYIPSASSLASFMIIVFLKEQRD